MPPHVRGRVKIRLVADGGGFSLDPLHWTVDYGGMLKLPHTKSCFVCGLNNPIGLKLDFETDGTRVRTRAVFGSEHVGFKGTVHGGFIATLLDEVMVWACGVQTKRFAYCAELTVRFLEPIKPGDELLATGELTANRRNRLFETSGRLENQAGTVLATATAKYLPIKGDILSEMLGDFAESTSSLFE